MFPSHYLNGLIADFFKTVVDKAWIIQSMPLSLLYFTTSTHFNCIHLYLKRQEGK